MKKRNLFTLCMLGATLIFTTSCSDDDDENDPVGPRLDVVEVASGTDSGEMTITQGAPVTFEWDARSGETNLQTFSVSVNGSNAVSPLPETNEGYDLPYTISNSENNLYVDGITFASAGTNLGSTEYTFTVTDGIGLNASVVITVNVISAASTISDPQNFEWTRVAGANGSGMSGFGLKWTNNSSTNAIVAVDGQTEMYSLPASVWTDITTQEELSAAIANGLSITQYTNVSVEESGTYNDVLGVVYNDTNYLINVQQGTVTTSSAGTTISILGQYKQ
ncbi:MAG: hypothetical protein ABR572_00575 [Cryomorphaceae bacterium]|nr:hypothetical protein [Flavobacteriales bacterium]